MKLAISGYKTSTFLEKPKAFDVGPRVLGAPHRIPCGSWRMWLVDILQMSKWMILDNVEMGHLDVDEKLGVLLGLIFCEGWLFSRDF